MVVIRIALACCVLSCWGGLSSYGAESPLRADKGAKVAPVRERARFEAPISVKPGSKTRQDYAKAERAWSERVLAAPFRERSKEEPWAGDAAKFVARTLDVWPGEILAPGVAELAAEGKAIIDKGCTDPLVAYLTGWARWEATGEWHAARNAFRDCLPAAEQLPGPRALARFIAFDFIRACEKHRDPKDMPEKAARLTAEVSQDGSYKLGEEFLLVHHTVTARWETPLDQNPQSFVTALQGSKLPEWALKTILGELELSLAWKARGNGFADKVTDEGWKGFQEHLKKARGYLVQAWKLRPDRPEAAALMITVVMGGDAAPGESIRGWWDRASAAELGFYDASMALMTAYLPRWGGSHQRMLAFAEACLDANRADSDLPLAMFCALGNMTRDAEDLRVLYSHPAVAPLVIRASQAVADDPTRARERRDRLSMLAVNAWLAGDDARAAKALKEVGPGALPVLAGRKLASVHVDEAGFRGELEVRNSPAREPFLSAEKKYANQDLASAMEDYRKAMEKAPEGPGRALVRGRIAIVETEQELAEGKWVTIHPDPDLAGWTAHEGKWFASPDGLPASRDSQGAIRMIYGARVGPDFEVRGEIAVTGEPAAEHMVGMIAGHSIETNIERWYGFYGYNDTDANAPRAIILDRDAGANAPSVPCQLKERNTFYIKAQNGKLTWEFNDQPMHTEFAIPASKAIRDNSRIGLGSWSHEAGVTMTLKHLEVRRLPGREAAQR